MRDAHESNSSGDEEFLRHRVSRFALLTAGISLGTLLIFRVPLLLSVGGTGMDALWEPTLGLHALAGLLLLGVFALARRGATNPRSLRSLELGGTVVFALAILAMTAFIPIRQHPHHIALFAIGGLYLARAIFVPSSGPLTLRLGVALGLPLLVLAYRRALEQDPLLWQIVGNHAMGRTRTSIAVSVATETAMWWSMFLALGTGASRVIFGLRKEVRSIRRLGQYTLERRLGEGGMGEVWSARHGLLRRPTAIKLLKRALYDEPTLARFEREVRATAALNHPNTVTIYDYGRTPDGTFYYAMELIEGPTLADLVARTGPMPPARVVHLLRQLVDALREAHEMGLVHRDVKPSNVMLCRRGGLQDVIKVVDFGLVKDVTSGESDLTSDGSVLGTPHYMPPEASDTSGPVDGRSDIYGVGATGYFLLTGTTLFPGRSLGQILIAHASETPERPSKRLGRAVPADLEDLLLQCLAKRPDQRPASARALVADLEALRDASKWTPNDAEDWWRSCLTAPPPASSDPTEASHATLVIDFEA